MSKATVLQRVIDDIAHKDLGKARDRLLGLVRTYPNDLELRHILGRTYFELQYPGAAGKFLFLVDDQDDRVQKAIRRFEKSCGDNPAAILRQLKLKGRIEDFPPGFAKDKLLLLAEQAKKETGVAPGKLEDYKPGKRGFDYSVVAGIGCLLILGTALILGLIQIGSWLFRLIQRQF